MSADIKVCGSRELARTNAAATVSASSIAYFAETSGACDQEIERTANATYSQGSQSLNSAVKVFLGKNRTGIAAVAKKARIAII